MSGGQLLEMPFRQSLLSVHQLFLPGVQAHVPDVDGELTGQDFGAGLF
jgi:hypothetical protein